MTTFIPAVACGFVLGAGYATALRENVKLYASGRAGVGAVLVHIARILIVVLAFVVAARVQRNALMGCFVGFATARAFWVRHWSAPDAT